MKTARKSKKLTSKSGEVRELTEADFEKGVAMKALPSSLQGKLKTIQTRGRPRAANPKQMISFRFSPDVLAGIRALGPGYNGQVENLLRQAFERGQL